MAEEPLTLKHVKYWKVPELKAFIRERGLQVTGSKEELVGRAYFSWEFKYPLVLTAEEVNANKQEHLHNISQTPDGPVPDPSTLKSWFDEERGM